MNDTPTGDGIGPGPAPDPANATANTSNAAPPPTSMQGERHRQRSSSSRDGGSSQRPQAPPLPPARALRSRHPSSDSQRKLRWLRLLAGSLAAMLIAAAVLGIFGLAQLQRFRNEANDLTSRVRQLDSDLARARERLEEMGADMRVLLANRIPGIAQIGYGRALDINERYLRNLTFVRGGENDQRIEYSMVLENTGPQPVLPKVRILLFDEAGLQTGSALFDAGKDPAGAPSAPLQPGESRNQTGPVDLQRQVPSVYFLVEVN